jgi:ParB-like chromosome segregation protein Spo0J
MSELSKYFKSETREISRSEITPADYNPRTISKEARAALKKSIKANGVIGGMVWNEYTSNLVSGHQKLSILDELNNYDPGTHENDYLLKVKVIQVDDKKEKELNIFFNNPSAQGEWDYDRLRDLLPDIDYKSAGLTDEDLSMIGFDINIATDVEESISDELEELNAPIRQEKERTREEKKAEMKQKKEKVLSQAEDKVSDLNSYVVLNFESYKNKSAFMLRFGYPVMEKFIKGEDFETKVERID